MEIKYHCLIVDDEPPAHSVIKSHISRTDNLACITSVFNGKEAIDELNQHQYDIVFLDIDMPLFSGIEVLQSVAIRPAVIMTTAYNHFAFDAYQLDAVDYLLKPISYPRFVKAIEKAKAFLELKVKNKPLPKSIFFKVDGYQQEFDFDAISYFQSIGNYIKIHFVKPKKTVLVYDSLKNLVENLPTEKFIQIHKSFIVNIGVVKHIEKEHIELQNSEKLPVGRKFKLIVDKSITNHL